MNDTLRSVDPRTGEHTGQPVGTTESGALDTACRAAEAVADNWANQSPERRAEICRAVADALRSQKDSIVAIADSETALGFTRLAGELERTCVQWELYSTAMLQGQLWDVTLDSVDPQAKPAPRPDLRRMNRPLGPVAVYAASNFPLGFSVAGTDTAAAIAVGCPVVAKAHEGHPQTSALVGQILSTVLRDEGAPAGVFSVVYGFQAGVDLIAHPGIKAAAFTGSLAGGRALYDAAAARPEPIPFFGELGSLNPVAVTRQAAATRGPQIARGFVNSFTLGSGQFCTKPGLLLLPTGHGLQETLREAVAATTPHPLLHANIAAGFRRSLATLTANPAVRTIVAPTVAEDGGFDVTAGLFAVSAAELPKHSDELLTEHFGPVSLLAEYDNEDELAQALKSLPGNLTGGIQLAGPLDPQAPALLAAMAAVSGRVVVDEWPTGVAVTWAMQHGGPWPSTTAASYTSVGQAAMRRFLRPVAFQNVPQPLLPEALRDDNPWNIERRVNGRLNPARSGDGVSAV